MRLRATANGLLNQGSEEVLGLVTGNPVAGAAADIGGATLTAALAEPGPGSLPPRVTTNATTVTMVTLTSVITVADGRRQRRAASAGPAGEVVLAGIPGSAGAGAPSESEATAGESGSDTAETVPAIDRSHCPVPRTSEHLIVGCLGRTSARPVSG